MLKSFFNKKRNMVVCIFVLIFIVFLMVYFFFNRKIDYNAFIELSLPNDSYGYVVYSPGNNAEFNIYFNSFLNIDTFFSDNKEHKYNYVIEDSSVISLENGVLIAKNIGKTNIYIITEDNIMSNIITLKVIGNEENDD